MPFDSEEVVYTEMLKDLASAVEVLTPKAVSGVKVMADYDLVFEGDATKWVKYANSLMLRLAMRIRSVKPELSKQYAKLAVEHSIGVMTDAGDAAGAGPGAGISLRNPMFWLADNYNDSRVGTTILSYLLGYQDPRLSAYCQPANSLCTVAVQAYDGKSYQEFHWDTCLPVQMLQVPNTTAITIIQNPISRLRLRCTDACFRSLLLACRSCLVLGRRIR